MSSEDDAPEDAQTPAEKRLFLEAALIETANARPGVAGAQADLDEAEAELNDVQSDLDLHKSRAKAAKAEIGDWKEWFASLSDRRKPEEIGKLQNEIARLAGNLAKAEAEIGALQPAFFGAQAQVQICRARLEGLHLEGDAADTRIASKIADEIAASKRAEEEAENAKP